MDHLDTMTPAQYRARYEALQAGARAKAGAMPDFGVKPAIGAGDVIAREVIPPGWYVALRLRRGEALHVENPHGTPGASVFLWNADDVSERFNAGDTAKLQWTTLIGGGRVLFSDMGRVMAAVIADSGAGHDPILGPSTPQTAGGARNGRDNLRSAAAKFGLGRRDVGPCLTLFAKMRVDAAGLPALVGAPPPGAFVTLRAEMNLLVALSNTPHPLATLQEATGEIGIVRYRAAPPGADDPCRCATEEAARGFENNDRYFA